MKLTLKIALGVFLGGAALLLVRAIPGWIAKQRAEKEEMREFNIREEIRRLTPEKLIARCGNPVKDTGTVEKYGGRFRDMTFRSPLGGDENMEFYDANRTPGSKGTGPPEWTLDPAPFSNAFGSDWERVLAEDLPCAVKTGQE